MSQRDRLRQNDSSTGYDTSVLNSSQAAGLDVENSPNYQAMDLSPNMQAASTAGSMSLQMRHDENYISLSEKGSLNGANIFEQDFKQEAYVLISIATPLMIYLGSQMIQLLTDLTILGHYGKHEFAAAAMGETWIQIMNVLLRASWLPLQTLVGQAYAAQNYHMCAIWFQIVTFIQLLMAIPCFLGYWYSRSILQDLDQVDSVLDLAQEFTRYMSISIIPTALFGMERNFFAGQKLYTPSAFVSAFAVAFNGILGYILVFEVYGFEGSPVASSIVRWITLFIYHFYCFNYMQFHKAKDTWVPWSIDNFTRDRVWRALYFVIPTLPAVILETWAFLTVALFAGSMGEDEIAVMVYSANFTLLLNAFVQGIALATNIRIARLLESGEPMAARYTAQVTLIITTTFGLLGACLIYFGQDLVSWIMTDAQSLQDKFSDIAPWVAFCFFLSSCITPMAKICMGQGRHGTMALIMLLTTWAVNIPCAYTIGVKEDGGIKGLWQGISIGYAIAALCLLSILWTSDWIGYSFDAQERANRSATREPSMGPQISRSVSQAEDANL